MAAYGRHATPPRQLRETTYNIGNQDRGYLVKGGRLCRPTTMNNRLKENIIQKSVTLLDLPHGKYKHFTYIVKRNRIISMGWNLTNKTHTWASKQRGYKYPFIHSELMALRNFPYPLAELHRYCFINVRLGAGDRPLLSKPCVACGRMLDAFGVRELYYSTVTGFREWHV